MGETDGDFEDRWGHRIIERAFEGTLWKTDLDGVVGGIVWMLFWGIIFGKRY